MRKLLYLSFCLMVAVGFGCAITHYPTITDNDQVANGQGSGVVNTNGKAHIMESQIATIWDDGIDNLFSFVDQKADGRRTITTYNNFTPAGALPVFHDDLYCNPDWSGCAIWTAQDGDGGSIFDGRWNQNCLGSRSLTYILSYNDRYYGECGRIAGITNLSDKLALMAEGDMQERFGTMGLLYRLTPASFSITLNNNAGVVSNLPMRGSAELWVGNRKSVLNMQNPLLGTVARSYAGWLDANGTDATTATLCLHGVCRDYNIAGNIGPSTPSRVMALANSRW